MVCVEWKDAQGQGQYTRGPLDHAQITGSLFREMHLSQILQPESELDRLRKWETGQRKNSVRKPSEKLWYGVTLILFLSLQFNQVLI